MLSTVNLGDFCADVQRKNIKHVHLSVYPPDGRVRISAPLYMELDTIRVFALAKLAWIKAQQRKIRAQERESPAEFLNRESYFVWGQRYLLSMIAVDGPPSIELKHKCMVFRQRLGASPEASQHFMDSWYRSQIRARAPALISKWEPILGVKAGRLYVQRMKTKWGSCNPKTGGIRLNTDLAKKPPECLEYIVVHELVHLLEPTHNARFKALMSQFLPTWQELRDLLNRLPVRHEEWVY